MPAIATSSCSSSTTLTRSRRGGRRTAIPIAISGGLLLELRGRREDAWHGVVFPPGHLHEPQHLGHRGLRGGQGPPQQVRGAPLRPSGRSRTRTLRRQLGGGRSSAASAARERIVARSDEDRETFLRKRGLERLLIHVSAGTAALSQVDAEQKREGHEDHGSTVMAAGVAIAMIVPHAKTCSHVNEFVARGSVGTGQGSGQNAGREGAMLAG